MLYSTVQYSTVLYVSIKLLVRSLNGTRVRTACDSQKVAMIALIAWIMPNSRKIQRAYNNEFIFTHQVV